MNQLEGTPGPDPDVTSKKVNFINEEAFRDLLQRDYRERLGLKTEPSVGQLNVGLNEAAFLINKNEGTVLTKKQKIEVIKFFLRRVEPAVLKYEAERMDQNKSDLEKQRANTNFEALLVMSAELRRNISKILQEE